MNGSAFNLYYRLGIIKSSEQFHENWMTAFVWILYLISPVIVLWKFNHLTYPVADY